MVDRPPRRLDDEASVANFERFSLHLWQVRRWLGVNFWQFSFSRLNSHVAIAVFVVHEAARGIVPNFGYRVDAMVYSVANTKL